MIHENKSENIFYFHTESHNLYVEWLFFKSMQRHSLQIPIHPYDMAGVKMKYVFIDPSDFTQTFF